MLKKLLGYLTILVLTFCLLTPAASGQDYANVKLEATKLTDNLFMVVGAGGNLGVSVGEDGILLIDDQFAPLVERIREKTIELSKGQGHSADSISYLINTHWHFDHTGGNEGFGMEAAILAHDNVRTRMAAGSESPRPTPPAPKVALPILTFKESVSLHWNGEEVKVVHFPTAHTDGDSIVWFTDSNVFHLGDQFFNRGTFPFVDLNSGGNALGLQKNIGEILPMVPSGAKIIPGHGPLATRQDLVDYKRMLDETIAAIKANKESGKSLEECQAAGVPEEWAGLGESGFIKTPMWVEIVYNSL